jgi:hypothetical protein
MIQLFLSLFSLGLQSFAAMFHRRKLFQYYAGDWLRCVEARTAYLQLQCAGLGTRLRLDNAGAEAVPIIREVFNLSDRMTDDQVIELASIFLAAWYKPEFGVVICPCVLVKG